jgi:hypothetical protein
MKIKQVIEGLRDPQDNPCWKGYKPVGTKKKAGKTVPNCVPTEDVEKTHKGGKIIRTAKGLRHEAPPGDYWKEIEKSEPDEDKLNKHFVNKMEKELGVKFKRKKEFQGGVEAESAGMLKVSKDDERQTILVNPSTGVQTQIDKTNPNAPRLTQDDQGKLKLTAPATGTANVGTPNLVGKDVAVDANEESNDIPQVNTKSAITGDEDHDEITKLLVNKLKKLANINSSDEN